MTVPEIKNICTEILFAVEHISVNGTQNMAQLLGINNAVQTIYNGVNDLEKPDEGKDDEA